MAWKLPLKSCYAKVLRKRGSLMHGMKEIIQEAESLPVEERAIIIDSLLRSLNIPKTEIDIEWARVAKRRLAELRSGQVNAIPGSEVFAKIRKRFDK